MGWNPEVVANEAGETSKPPLSVYLAVAWDPSNWAAMAVYQGRPPEAGETGGGDKEITQISTWPKCS